MPTANAAAPTSRVQLADLFVDLSPLASNGASPAGVPLNWCHESDAAVAVPLVVPVTPTPSPSGWRRRDWGRGALGSQAGI